MALGDGPFIAITSDTGQHGTWFIVTDGIGSDSVRTAAISLIANDSSTTQFNSYTAAQAGIAARIGNLAVLTRAGAIGYVGAAGLQSYVGNLGMLGPGQKSEIVR